MKPLQVQPTPNPNSLKFSSPGKPFIASGMRAFASAAEAAGDPIGEALFAFEGVANVFVVPGFVTVTKQPAASWDLLLPQIEGALTEHLGGG